MSLVLVSRPSIESRILDFTWPRGRSDLDRLLGLSSKPISIFKRCLAVEREVIVQGNRDRQQMNLYTC